MERRVERKVKQVARVVEQTRLNIEGVAQVLDTARNALFGLRDRVLALEAAQPFPPISKVERETAIDSITNIAAIKNYLKTLLPKD
jgi:hypothetical protein